MLKKHIENVASPSPTQDTTTTHDGYQNAITPQANRNTMPLGDNPFVTLKNPPAGSLEAPPTGMTPTIRRHSMVNGVKTMGKKATQKEQPFR